MLTPRRAPCHFVQMVTGDNVTTARAIARKCGILVESRGDTVLEGPEFRTRVLDANGNIKQEEMDAYVFKFAPVLQAAALVATVTFFFLPLLLA